MNGQNIKQVFESLYPTDLAYEWDNVGLQIGSLNKEINTILLTLDVTDKVVLEAVENKVDLIIAHHPLIFTGIKNINTDHYQGSMIETLIKNDISLYIAHTNFDISNYGMDSMLANMLSLKNLENLDDITDNEGLGKVGEVKETSMKDFIDHVKNVFDIQNVRFIGDLNQSVKTVAISGGSGSSNMFNAVRKKADLFITGDVTYHKALDALSLGINTLDVGHHIEHHFMKHLKDVLIQEGVTSKIITSKVNTNPYQNL